jgi:uncharacterized protein YodC (DUF2158 family)
MPDKKTDQKNDEKTDEFKVGDIVQLKSGGPKMTVGERPLGHSARGVYCQWFAGSKLESGYFSPATLARPTEKKTEGKEEK